MIHALVLFYDGESTAVLGSEPNQTKYSQHVVK